MAFIAVFFEDYGLFIQALCVLGVSFMSMVIQYNNHPFEDPELNRMEYVSLLSSTGTLYTGLYFLSGKKFLMKTK